MLTFAPFTFVNVYGYCEYIGLLKDCAIEQEKIDGETQSEDSEKEINDVGREPLMEKTSQLNKMPKKVSLV